MGTSRLWKAVRHTDGQVSYQFAFSASYLVVCPSLQDHLLLDSRTLQVRKPLFYFRSAHLTEEPFFHHEGTHFSPWRRAGSLPSTAWKPSRLLPMGRCPSPVVRLVNTVRVDGIYACSLPSERERRVVKEALYRHGWPDLSGDGEVRLPLRQWAISLLKEYYTEEIDPLKFFREAVQFRLWIECRDKKRWFRPLPRCYLYINSCQINLFCLPLHQISITRLWVTTY